MLANLDSSVGSVLQKVRTLGLAEDTLIFFLSDNGGPTRELTSSNRPLRGEKGQMYEGGIRVPFLVQWPGTLPAGVVYERPVSSLDIYPTSVQAAGGTPSPRLDGVDLVPHLTGRRPGSPHEVLYWRQGWRKALRMGDWKLVCMSRPNQPETWELYNLAEDVAETANRASAEPEQLAACRAQWERLNQAMRTPLFP